MEKQWAGLDQLEQIQRVATCRYIVGVGGWRHRVTHCECQRSHGHGHILCGVLMYSEKGVTKMSKL